jgi:hypothetical protein
MIVERRIVLVTGAGSRHNIAFYRNEGYQPAPRADANGTTHLTKDLVL